MRALLISVAHLFFTKGRKEGRKEGRGERFEFRKSRLDLQLVGGRQLVVGSGMVWPVCWPGDPLHVESGVYAGRCYRFCNTDFCLLPSFKGFSSLGRAKLHAFLSYSTVENTQLSPSLTEKPCREGSIF